MPIKVIVAGLPRTGTTSTRMALEQLGYTKTMHMDACIDDPRLMAAWKEIYEKHLEKTWTSQDWRDFFDKRFPGYVAGIDCPFADFALEIAQAYPEAKVILQYRDPETWFISFQNLINEACFSRWEAFCIWPLTGVYALHQLMKPRLVWWQDVYNYPISGKQIMPFYCNKMKSLIESERLLTFKMQDGWAPLCRFLKKPIPPTNFPEVNNAKSMAKVYSEWKRQGLRIWTRWLTSLALLVIILTVSISMFWRRS